jgi:hypothetical protein
VAFQQTLYKVCFGWVLRDKNFFHGCNFGVRVV